MHTKEKVFQKAGQMMLDLVTFAAFSIEFSRCTVILNVRSLRK